MKKTCFFLFTFAAIALTVNITVAQQSFFVSTQSKPAGLYAQDEARYTPEESYELPWNYIREENVAWRKRVWRELDVRNDKNHIFTGNKNLGSILIDGSLAGACKLYSGSDDRFMQQLTRQDIVTLLSNGPKNGFNPAQTTKYRIKEDWLFLKNENKLVVRIAGIAPMRTVVSSDGNATEQPAFWAYYPETRNYLVQQKVVDKEHPYILNWDELFEGRQFDSKIERVTNSKPYSTN